MDLLKLVPALIPLFMQLLSLVMPIIQALRAGESVLELLKTKGPALIEYIQKVGRELFPNLSDEDAAQAGALRSFDQESVKVIQTGINKLASAGLITLNKPLVVDGSYGTLTKAAVEMFQKSNGLEVDGWAGKLTSAVMQVALAKLEAPAAMAKVVEAQAVVQP